MRYTIINFPQPPCRVTFPNSSCLSPERAPPPTGPAVPAASAAAGVRVVLPRTAAAILLPLCCIRNCLCCLPSLRPHTPLVKLPAEIQQGQLRKEQLSTLRQQQRQQPLLQQQGQQAWRDWRAAAVCRWSGDTGAFGECRRSTLPFSPFIFFRHRGRAFHGFSSLCAFSDARALEGTTVAALSLLTLPLHSRSPAAQPCGYQYLPLERAVEVSQQHWQQQQQRQQQPQRHTSFLSGPTWNRWPSPWGSCSSSREAGRAATAAGLPQRKSAADAVGATSAETAFSPARTVTAAARAATACPLGAIAAAAVRTTARTYTSFTDRVLALPRDNISVPPRQQRHEQQSQSLQKRDKASAMENRAQSIVPYDSDNVFKKIIAGQIPCHKIFETEHVLAILDAFPAVAGHSLLIQKKEVSSIFDMDEETAAAVFRELPRLCRAVQKATNCDGINVLQNNGRAAGQVVFHAHVHVVPRFANDGLFKQFAGSKEMIRAEDAKEMVDKIRAHL